MLSETLKEFGVKISLAFDGKKAQEAEDKISALAANMRHLGLEAAALAAGVFEFGNLFSSNARSLSDQASQLGINTKKLQEYEYAAKVAANVNRDELVSSLHQVGNLMDKARAGDAEARQVLIRLSQSGIGTTQMLKNLSDKSYSVTDAMKDLSLGIQNVYKNSPIAAARLAEMAFGTDKLIPLLKQGPKAFDDLAREADKNWVINEKMIEQGKAMDVQFTKIWFMIKKLGYEIGFNVLKHIKPMVDQFVKWFQANKKIISSGINDFLDVSADILKAFFEVVVQVTKELGPFIEQLGGSKEAIKLFFEIFAAYKAAQIVGNIIQIGTALGGLAVSMAPLLPYIVSIGALALAINALWEVFNGKNFEDTWLSKLMSKLEHYMELIAQFLHIDSNFGGGSSGNGPNNGLQFPAQGFKLNTALAGEAGRFREPLPIKIDKGEGSDKDSPQTFNFTNTQNIVLPAGMPSHIAVDTLSKSTTDAHEKMLTKAKQDAARKGRY